MMIHAYNEIYLDSAMKTLAETFSYVSGGEKADLLFEKFIMSGVGYQFGRGNPKYINMPSHELFHELFDYEELKNNYIYGRSPEYWCGYVIAYYQWYTGISFEIIKEKLPPSRILLMYHPLHEAGLDKFVDVANDIIYERETKLAKFRKAAGLSQKKLAKYSGVSERAIQMYEQRQLNINLASADKLYKISKVLGCHIEDLIEFLSNT